MQAHAYFLTLARYNVWATGQLLEAVNALPDADYRRDCGLFLKSIHGTLNHLWVGEHGVWRKRFADWLSPQVALNAEVHADRAVLAQQLLLGAQAWQPLIEGWDDARFEGTLHYRNRNLSGVAMSLPFATTLDHVFNHGTHHRGQITAALTAMGQPCPELDLIYLLQSEQVK
ncbi:DinB family protein [Rhodoferax sp. PAMC 29310]|uniref:DinB family protein n=1 Tax=Rhodoferax sp. PAMC 29310 TaxID=2822760 RepID=UPI001B31C5EE|nr:DinB family protein [Rhodoferax sp. PAMC 29310]